MSDKKKRRSVKEIASDAAGAAGILLVYPLLVHPDKDTKFTKAYKKVVFGPSNAVDRAKSWLRKKLR